MHVGLHHDERSSSRKHKFVTWLPSGSFNSKLILTQAYFVDLRGNSSFGLNLGSQSVEGVTLLGVREVFNLKDFELPILIDKGKDEEGVVVDCGAVSSGPDGGHLHRGDMLKSETTQQLCTKGQT